MVINQFRGVGDIIFLQPLISELKRRTGEEIYFPVNDVSIGDYIPDGHFVDKNAFQLDYESTETTNPDYFPARFANQIVRKLKPSDHSDQKNTMLDKYKLADKMFGNIDPSLWLDINLVRNKQKEEELFKLLGEPTNFHLINENTGEGKQKIKAKIGGKAKRVKMEYIEGFTLVDWCGIMEKAKSNHHVSTSTFYLMQMLKLENCHIYPRENGGFEGIEELVKMCEFDCNLVTPLQKT